MHIKFKPASLLYGESVFWITTFCFAPFYWYPDLEVTRHRTAISELSLGRHLTWLIKRLHGTWFASTLWPAIVSASQVMYLVIYVVFGLVFQTPILELFEIYKTEDSLTYLALFYCPTILRLVVLFTTVTALTRIRAYNAWTNYDRCDYFAVDKSFQKRVMLLCVLSIIPDCVFIAIETFVILDVTFSATFAGFFKSEPSALLETASFIFNIVLLGVSVVNVITRQKPLIDMIYQCACLRKHFQCINSQIVSVETTVETNRMFFAPSFVSHEPAPYLSEPVRFELAGSDTLLKAVGRRRKMSNAPVLKIQMLSDSNADSLKKSYLMGTDTHCVLTNVNQLERHLTQVNLFIKKLDNEAPTSVFALALADMIFFFYTILRFHLDYNQIISWNSFMTIAGLGWTTFSLCVLGQSLNRECRSLSNKLEVIYLQEQSHSLLYKQKTDAQFVLGRIFDLLENMKFDCNGLMKINWYTIIKGVFYSFGGVFLIMQYDIVATSP